MNITVKVDIDDICCPICRKLRLTALGPVSEQPSLPGPQPGEPMLAVLADSQQGVVTYGLPLDKRNKPAQVQGLAFVSSDETVAKFVAGVPDASGAIVPQTGTADIQGTIVAGNPGVAQVWVEADSDLGDGKTIIVSEKVDVQVTGGVAVGFGAPVFGTPTEQP